jgi:hypothetical protein
MRWKFSRLFAVSSLLLAVAVQVVAAQTPQDVQRSVEKERWNIADPIRIITVFYDGKPIKSRVPFSAPDDWLNHISVSIENDSGKTLIAGYIEVGFREFGEPLPIKSIRFGRYPDIRMHTSTGEKISRWPDEVPVSIAPGQSIIVKLASDYKRLEELIDSRGSLSQVTSCFIQSGAFYFDDNTRWMTGSYTRADPSNPGTYTPITREDFNKKQ